MTAELNLHHNLIKLPAGKTAGDTVAERHDLVLLFDATKANPNGDPDMGNMPRRQPDTLKGLVTDVCLKRKIRNFFSLYNPDGTLITNGAAWPGYQIFIRENAVLKDALDQHYQLVCKRVFDQLVGSLHASGYLDHDSEIAIRDAQWGEDEYPEPKKCVEYISKHCKGVFKLELVPEAVAAKLRSGGRTPPEVVEAVRGIKFDSGVRDEKGVTKAVLDAVKKASPDGAAATCRAAAQAALDNVSPWSLLSQKFGQLELERLEHDAVCAAYFDNRAFGAVTSTDGPLKGSFYGQIRGPIQMAFAESIDKTLQLDSTITRCAVASVDEKSDDEGGNRTMGRKHVVDYGLYRTHIYFSPAFAAKTGFTYYDLDNFLFALTMLYRDDAAAGRSGMRVVGLIDFQHSSALGDEHSHRLFKEVVVKRRDSERDFPSSLDDYQGTAPGVEGGYVCVRSVQENGQTRERVWARCLVWEIPAPRGDADRL